MPVLGGDEEGAAAVAGGGLEGAGFLRGRRCRRELRAGLLATRRRSSDETTPNYRSNGAIRIITESRVVLTISIR